MGETTLDKSLSTSERAKARILGWAPWLAPFLLALPGPALFTILYLMAQSTEAAALYVFLGIASLAGGFALGLLVAIILLFYRRSWLTRLREGMAVDGISADEVKWFTNEMTTSERQALKEIEGRNLLLADAYRETLAARLTASRVMSTARRELLLVERRLNRTAYMQGQTNATLQEELKADRARLGRVRQEATERRAEAESRLQMIEAASSRGANWTETSAALQRLNATQGHMPLALESARLDQQFREDIEKELKELTRTEARTEEGEVRET